MNKLLLSLIALWMLGELLNGIHETIKLVEKSFTYQELLKADEVFLTSSGSFITPILTIDKKKINNSKIGSTTLRLAEMYAEECKNLKKV